MKISGRVVRSKLGDKALTGLTLSFLTTLMKANKTNNASPVTHFFRERLKSRSDRKALNVVLNVLCADLAKQNKVASKQKPMLLSSMSEASTEPTIDRKIILEEMHQYLDSLDKESVSHDVQTKIKLLRLSVKLNQLLGVIE